MSEFYNSEDVMAGRMAYGKFGGYSGRYVNGDMIRLILDAVAPAIAARALRKYADSLIAELVCCDIYDGKGTGAGHGHEICYWGGAAAQGARVRADEIERGQS